jgi:hypothetical protein
MFSKKLVLSLCSSLFIFFSYSYSAIGSLLIDPDGLNVSLYTDGFPGDNEFGPISVTMGYDPLADGNVLPAGMNDDSEMEVSFFANSISFTQEVTTSLSMPLLTLGWTMIIDDIDWPDAEEIVSANISFSTYPIALSVDFTANSLTIRYDGGGLLTPGELGTRDLWEGTATFDTAAVRVPAPPVLSLLLLGCLGFYFKPRVR